MSELYKNDPHLNQPVLFTGEKIESAKAAMILIHGRGSTSQDILTFSNEFMHPGFLYAAPQAFGNTWYPYSFLRRVEENEPGLSSALNAIDTLLNKILKTGIPQEKIILLGFSQGACLTLEYAARNAGRYGGIVGFSGGLVGDKINRENYKGSFEQTPVFLGCSDIDFHIPKERVDETEEIIKNMGGNVIKRIYKNMGHTINSDEISFVQNLINQMTINPGS
jgi:predicted esterase